MTVGIILAEVKSCLPAGIAAEGELPEFLRGRSANREMLERLLSRLAEGWP